jgi:hypothetical protein
MNLPPRIALAVALLCAGAAASAGTVTFDFSYAFGDGRKVTGDFSGTTTNGGQSVTNIGNIRQRRAQQLRILRRRCRPPVPVAEKRTDQSRSGHSRRSAPAS